MPPYLPVLSISRSQNVRLGRGPGNQNVAELNSGVTPFNPQTGALIGPFYADLGNGNVRKDYQHHQTLGALIDVGATSNTVYSDLFAQSGLVVSAGTGFALNVSAGVIQSRYSGAQLAVPASGQTLLPAAPPAFGGRSDQVICSAAGMISLVPGGPDAVAPVYEVQSFLATGATAGTFTYAFTYNGFLYVTAPIAFNAAGTAIASAMLAATGGPNNQALSAVVGAGTLTGNATLVNAGPAIVTASGALEGPIVTSYVNNSALTGGAAVVTRTTQGVGNMGPIPGGGSLILANVYVPSTATSAANYVITTGVKLTS